MKIVRIIARLNVGGPAVHVVLLTRGLQDRGHKAHLLVGPVTEDEGSMEYYAAEHRVELNRIDELVRPLSPWKDLRALWTIYCFLRQEKPDVVHTHTSKAGTVGRLAALLAGTPVIFHTFHGNVFDGYFSRAKTRLFLSIERTLARFTDRVITVSEALKSQLSQIYRIAPANKIQVLPLGLELTDLGEVFERRLTRSTVASSSPLVIGWVGRFTDIKDPILFVRLAAALNRSDPEVKFLMVGDGPLRGAVEEAIHEAGLATECELLGWQRKMAEIYSRFDLVVSTSLNEGTPVTIIEAMAAGRPFVAPDVGGLIDLTGGDPEHNDGFTCYRNGVLVNSRDVRSFQLAVLKLVRDTKLRMQMSRAGHDFALKTFDKDRLVRETELLYETFLHRQCPSAMKYQTSSRSAHVIKDLR